MSRSTNRFLAIALMPLLLALQACETRSISNSGYDANQYGYGRGGNNPFYQGELTEFDVLGIERKGEISESDITRALDTHKQVALAPGSAVMLIQSGAAMPDQAMVDALSSSYRVGIFGGQPPGSSGREGTGRTLGAKEEASASTASYSDSLRLAAARGGYQTLIVYWGVLESGKENLATRNVSWVPVVGWALPDQRQRMRIRLKIAIIDVRSGSWDLFAPQAIEDASISSMMKRTQADQNQVELLKRKAYSEVAPLLAARYSSVRG